MVNEEILQGLRIAIQRGYSLEQAMMSFWNAGYENKEIEEAARALYKQYPDIRLKSSEKKKTKPNPKSSKPQKSNEPKEPQKPKSNEPKEPQNDSKDKSKTKEYDYLKSEKESKKEAKEPKKVNIQKASKYGEKTKPKSKITIILVILLIIIVISLLAGVFIFRNSLLNFFQNLF